MKRDIFSDLMEGIEALANERLGKVTLRTHAFKLPKLAPNSDEEVPALATTSPGDDASRRSPASS